MATTTRSVNTLTFVAWQDHYACPLIHSKSRQRNLLTTLCSPDYEACAALAGMTLNSSDCGAAHCVLGAPQPATSDEFIALAGELAHLVCCPVWAVDLYMAAQPSLTSTCCDAVSKRRERGPPTWCTPRASSGFAHRLALPDCCSQWQRAAESGRCTAGAGFFVVFHFFGLQPGAGLAELERAGRRHCAQEWEPLAAVRGAELQMDQYCFRRGLPSPAPPGAAWARPACAASIACVHCRSACG